MTNYESNDPLPKGSTAKMPRITEDIREQSLRQDYGQFRSARQYDYANQYSRYAAQPYHPAPEPMQGGRICKRCHHPLGETDTSCSYCGANVQPVYKRAWFWLLLIVFSILLGVGAYILTHPSHSAGNASQESNEMIVRDQEVSAPLEMSGNLLGDFTSSLTQSWTDKLMNDTPLGEVSFVNGVGMEGMTPVVYIDKAGMEAEGYTVDMLVEIANNALKEHSEEYGLEGLTDLIGAELAEENFVLQ